MKRYVLFLFVFLFSSKVIFSQTYGKIFTRDEANILFGSAIQSITINVSTLYPLLNQTRNFLMFKIAHGMLILLGDNRKIILPSNYLVESSESFSVFSKNKIMELLTSGSNVQITFEMRADCMSISTETSTLELAPICPPFCP